MDVEPDRKVLSRLDTAGFSIGDQILFCPLCLWQTTQPAVTKNKCPDCGSDMHTTRVDSELLELCRPLTDLHLYNPNYIIQQVLKGKKLECPRNFYERHIRIKLRDSAAYQLANHRIEDFFSLRNEVKRLDDFFGITAEIETEQKAKKEKEEQEERLLYEKLKAKYGKEKL